MNKKCVMYSSSLFSPTFKFFLSSHVWIKVILSQIEKKTSTTSMNVRHECDIIKHNWILSVIRINFHWSIEPHTLARGEEENFSIDRKDVMQKKKLSAFSLAITTTTRENRWERKLEDEIVSDCEENFVHFVDILKAINQNSRKKIPLTPLKLIKLFIYSIFLLH